MFTIAFKMLGSSTARTFVSFLGIMASFLLAAVQIGLLIGWCHTTSAIVRHADCDLWVVARHTSAFDFGTPIPEQKYYEVRSVPGVASAQRLLSGWVIWQCPNGKLMNLEMVGVDDGLVGAPWNMAEGSINVLHRPMHVIVDQMYLRDLGVEQLGQHVEILDHRVRVGGYSRDVRTFTAAPFVFGSLETARQCSPIYQADEITYVLAKCEPGHDPLEVRERLQSQLASVEVLTREEFAVRTMKYWMLETGAGVSVILTALLGLIVGTVITSQTLYAITNDHLSNYAMLLAVGFGRWQLVQIVVLQSIALGLAGIAGGSVLFWLTSQAVQNTRLAVDMIPLAFFGLVVAILLSCLLATFLSVRTIWHIDPVSVFRR